MKKLLLALVATAAFTGSASAADLAARPYTKAPVPMAPLYNWTGFYIFGGAGGGLWNADSNVVTNPRSEEHTSELQSRFDLVCRLLLEKKKKNKNYDRT